MPEQKTATDQLLDVIRIIQFAHQTGVLMVERNDVYGHEEGEIIFIKGHTQSARTGDYQGEDAFNWLQSWKQCRFKFIHKSSDEISQLVSSQPINVSSRQQTPPVGYTIPHQSRQTAALAPIQSPVRQTAPLQPKIPQRLHRNNQESMNLLEQYQFSRVHRHIYLLIDGQRSPQELARLTGKRVEEIYLYLNELEQARLIQ